MKRGVVADVPGCAIKMIYVVARARDNTGIFGKTWPHERYRQKQKNGLQRYS